MNMKIRTAAGGGLASKKLLAAIAVLAVAFAVFAAIPAVADDSDAATITSEDPLKDMYASSAMEYAKATGVYTLKADTVVTLTKDVTLSQVTFTGAFTLTFKSADGNKLTYTYDVANPENQSSLFAVSKIVFDNVDADMDILASSKSGDATAADNNKATWFVFDKPDVKDAKNDIEIKTATVTISESSWNGRVSGGNTTITMADKDAKLVLDGANSITAHFKMTNGATFEVKNPNFTAANIYADEIEDSTITVSGAEGHDLILYSGNSYSLKNSTVDTDGNLGIYITVANNVLDAQGTEISAEKLVPVYSKYANDGPAQISGATIDVKTIEVGEKAKTEDGSEVTPAAIALTDVTIAGTTEIAAGLTVTVDSSAVIAKDAALTVKGTLTVNSGAQLVDAGKLDASAGTLTLTGTLAVIGSGSAVVPSTFDQNSADKIAVEGASNVSKVQQATTDGNTKTLTGTKMDASTPLNATNFASILAEGPKNATVPTAGVAISEDVVLKSITTLKLEGALTIAAGCTFTVEGKIVGENKNIVLQKDATTKTVGQLVVDGGSVTATVSYDNNNTLKLENATGDFAVAPGSLYVNGTIADGSVITATAGDVYVTGTVTGDVKIVKDESTSAKLYLGTEKDGLTVASGAKLTLTGEGILVKGDFYLYGELTTTDGNKLAVNEYTNADQKKVTPSFKAFSGAKIYNVEIVGDGKIDLSLAQGPQTVGEDISSDKIYGQLENVTIVGSLTIKNNATVEVLGGFNVNEGVVLTIEKGSELIINSSAASMVVEGKIVVEEGAKLTVVSAKDVKVSGAIESEGTVSINSKVTVKSGGSIVISDGNVSKPKTAINNSTTDVVKLYSSVFEPKQGLVIEAGATLTVKSLIYTATTDTQTSMVIENKGTVIFDKAVIGASINVKMLADGAVVQIVSVENIATSVGTDGKATAWADEALSITDAGLKFPDKSTIDTENLIIINSKGYAFKGLTVVEKITSEVDDNGDTVYENHMDLAGSVSAAKVEEVSNADKNTYNLVFSIVGPYQDVSGELTLGKNVVLNVTRDAKLSVSGKLIATEEGSKIENKGEITVTGLIQVAGSGNKIADVINAAMYETRSGTDTIYNYTTLKAAVDAAAKDITVLGTVKVDESFTVPKDTTVKNEGTIVVGSDDDTEVTLTFADGAVLKAGTVDVKGTLYFENKKDNKASKIESDVSVIGEKDARYTNLFTALNNAKAGDTVTVDRNVDLKKSITIKEGVTLDVPVSKTLTVFAGVTITVNGTLKTATKVLLDENVAFAGEANKREDKAAIVANGVFMSMDEQTYAYYQIAGAYYHLTDSVGDYNYITTLENASKSDATKVYVYGKVTAGDVAFTGTSTTAKNVYVMEGADLTVASITLDKAKLEVQYDENSTGKFTGDVKVGDSAVTAKNVTYFNVEVDKDGLMIVRTVFAVDDKSAFTVSAGKVAVFYSGLKTTTIAAGAELTSYKDQTSNIYGELVIDGTVTVANEQEISAYTVTVKGTLSIADATDSKGAGKFTVNGYLYIGITDSDLHDKKVKLDTGDAASVTGAVTGVKVAFVKADATVSEATIDSFKVNGVLKSTTYIVEDKDWITAYAVNGNENINYVNIAPVENAEFKYWQNTDGDVVKYTSNIGDSKCDKVTASIDYEIYAILVNPAAGIESIAIDGNLMQFGSITDYDGSIRTQMYYIVVKAGTHDITCKLANGYSGEAKFAIVDSLTSEDLDASVSGNKVTVSGDAGSVTIQITGISASGYVQPTEPAQDDKDDGLSLTDILLIILVVLIVVMAIIVALRLMRS